MAASIEQVSALANVAAPREQVEMPPPEAERAIRAAEERAARTHTEVREPGGSEGGEKPAPDAPEVPGTRRPDGTIVGGATWTPIQSRLAIGYLEGQMNLFFADANLTEFQKQKLREEMTQRITDLRSQELLPAGLPVIVGNTLEGDARGIEVGVNVQPFGWWRTHVGYTRLETEIRRTAGSRDVGGGVTEANDPDHIFGLRSSLDLPYRIELDAMLRSIAALPNPAVPSYTELNVRAGWWATPRAEIWFAGQDLLHDRHPEFGPALPARVEFERSVRVGITVRTP